MKKIISILILCLIVGCNGNIKEQSTENKQNEVFEQLEIYKKINYTEEDVINKNFYVVTNRGIIYNKDTLIKFLNHEITSFTMAYFTDEGDMILNYIYYNGNNYHVIMDTTRDEYGYKGYYENEYTTLEIQNYYIILKDNIKVEGNNEDTIYNSIEMILIPNFDSDLIEIINID